MYDNYNLIIYNDNIGRTCFGELIETDTKSRIHKVKNPAMILVSPNETGQMKVDVIPLFFAEFVKANEGEEKFNIFNVKDNNITVIDVNLTDRILEHYFTKINIKPEYVEESKTEETPEVEVFDK